MANPAFQTDEVGIRTVPPISTFEPTPEEGDATIRLLMDNPLPERSPLTLHTERQDSLLIAESIKRHLLEKRVEKLEGELARTRTNYFRVTQAIAKALRTAGIAIEVPELLNHDTLPPAA